MITYNDNSVFIRYRRLLQPLMDVSMTEDPTSISVLDISLTE